MKIEEQIKKLEKIVIMIRKAHFGLDNMSGVADEIEHAKARGEEIDPQLLLKAHQMMKACPEFCICDFCRATDPVLWRHLLIKYGCQDDDRMDLMDRKMSLFDRLVKLLLKEDDHVSLSEILLKYK